MAQVLPFLTIITLGLAAVSGCQQNSSMVDNLPAPNFNGPVIMPQIAAASPAHVSTSPAKPVPSAAPLRGDRAWAINVPARPWKYIVIHHSATPSGNAAKFDKEHKLKWDELGYHFVIGNGTDSGNGQVEVGPRWPKQKWGAHAKTPDNRYNDYGIGICLVGNFDIERPTKEQLDSLARLVSYLMQTYKISEANVIGHRDTKNTDCPGSNLDVMLVRSMAKQRFADTAFPADDAQKAANAVNTLEPIANGVSSVLVK